MKHISRILPLLAAILPAQGALVSTLNSNGRTVHVQTSTGGSFISLADLQTIVTARGDLTTAAVLTGEAADGTSSTTIATELANAGDPALFSFSGPNRYSRNDAAVALAATSGARFGLIADSNTWNVGSTIPLQGVTHFGTLFYNYLTGGAANLVSVTATFDDATTAVYTATAATFEYTFVGFAAPDGKFITSVQVTETAGGGWLGFDDVTIVTSVVPEPSSALLGALGLIALWRRRV
jgi:MYXO-CTERM domain-containing protein